MDVDDEEQRWVTQREWGVEGWGRDGKIQDGNFFFFF